LFYIALPFVLFSLGFVLGYFKWFSFLNRLLIKMFNLSLFVLLFVIGAKLATNQEVLKNLMILGLKSFGIMLFAALGSMLLIYLFERKAKVEVAEETLSENHDDLKFVGVLVLTVILGGVAGAYLLPEKLLNLSDSIITLALAFLYLGTGVSFGKDQELIRKVREKGVKIISFPLLALLGSILGGVAFALIFKINPGIAVSSASGMGFYSVTTAILAKNLGIEAGTIGFLANVLRELFTILLTPLLARLFPYFPLALAGATSMDTTLGVVTRVQGPYYGAIALLSGTVLTIIVPVILPFLTLL